MNAATNQPSILTLRLGQSNQAGHLAITTWMSAAALFSSNVTSSANQPGSDRQSLSGRVIIRFTAITAMESHGSVPSNSCNSCRIDRCSTCSVIRATRQVSSGSGPESAP